MLLTAGRLIKYDLKELFKKHIALYIVTLLAAFGCWALHVLSEYVPDNGITPVAYPVMIAVYVIVCVVLFIVSIVFVILYFRRSMLKDEGYLTHTLPVPVWLIYVCNVLFLYVYGIYSQWQQGCILICNIYCSVYCWTDIECYCAFTYANKGEW